MGLYRCASDDCDEGGSKGAPFESASANPACPLCAGTDVTALVPVHYLVADPTGPIRTGLGRRAVACAPKDKKLPQCSGTRDAVTCPACRATAVFKGHEADGTDQHERHFERIAEGKLSAPPA